MTSNERLQPKQPLRWWKRILFLNFVLIGLYGAIAVAGFAALGGRDGFLSGVVFEGSWAQLSVETLLVIGIGFGLPNLLVILWTIVSDRRN
ncbi:MAG: hypothetical protein MUC83_15875 [Pirellula sp.]|nr:hypothetical protein [Pirellula sp.]